MLRDKKYMDVCRQRACKSAGGGLQGRSPGAAHAVITAALHRIRVTSTTVNVMNIIYNNKRDMLFLDFCIEITRKLLGRFRKIFDH